MSNTTPSNPGPSNTGTSNTGPKSGSASPGPNDKRPKVSAGTCSIGIAAPAPKRIRTKNS